MEEKLNYMNKAEDRGCALISKLFALSVAVKPGLCFDALCSDDDFEKLLGLLEATDPKSLQAWIADDQIYKYRTVNDKPLKGLLLSGGDAVTVDFKDLPEDHIIPEVVELQANYLVRRMFANCRRKLICVACDTLSQDFEKQKPETAWRIQRVVETLVDRMTPEELDKIADNRFRKKAQQVLDQAVKTK